LASASFASAVVSAIARLSWFLPEVTMAGGMLLNWTSWKLLFVAVRTRSGQTDKATTTSV
jgi:hypothetical protein